jgi:hypothetical protein
MRYLAMGLLLVAISCGGGYGSTCSSDSECGELQCLAIANPTDTGVVSSCDTVKKICTKVCNTDQDCKGLASDSVCSSMCTGKRICN